MTTGHLAEVFLSFQGEGTHVGRAQVFVRLGGCPLRCRYCDTPGALVAPERFRVGLPDGTERWGDNPVDVAATLALLDEVDPDGLAEWISLTGGEPLAQQDFLAELLSRCRPRQTYLETAGAHPEALERVVDGVDVVAMDIKLPSVSGERDLFDVHEDFLRIAKRSEVFVKVVVSPALDVSELARAAALVARVDPTIPFVLQPETDRRDGRPHSGTWMFDLLRVVRADLRDVRLVPQTHKFLGVA